MIMVSAGLAIKLSVRRSEGTVGGLRLGCWLFPYKINFTPHCLSSPRCINGYWRHTAGDNPVVD